jgi:hypothetical protein
MAPFALSRINFRSVYRFPIDQYLDGLLPSARQPEVATV